MIKNKLLQRLALDTWYEKIAILSNVMRLPYEEVLTLVLSAGYMKQYEFVKARGDLNELERK